MAAVMHSNIIEKRLRGFVLYYDDVRGFGVIERCDTLVGVYVHQSEIIKGNTYDDLKSLAAKDLVEFDLFVLGKDTQAKNVIFIHSGATATTSASVTASTRSSVTASTRSSVTASTSASVTASTSASVTTSTSAKSVRKSRSRAIKCKTSSVAGSAVEEEQKQKASTEQQQETPVIQKAPAIHPIFVESAKGRLLHLPAHLSNGQKGILVLYPIEIYPETNTSGTEAKDESGPSGQGHGEPEKTDDNVAKEESGAPEQDSKEPKKTEATKDQDNKGASEQGYGEWYQTSLTPTTLDDWVKATEEYESERKAACVSSEIDDSGIKLIKSSSHSIGTQTPPIIQRKRADQQPSGLQQRVRRQLSTGEIQGAKAAHRQETAQIHLEEHYSDNESDDYCKYLLPGEIEH